jgi:hypothetical protein
MDELVRLFIEPLKPFVEHIPGPLRLLLFFLIIGIYFRWFVWPRMRKDELETKKLERELQTFEPDNKPKELPQTRDLRSLWHELWKPARQPVAPVERFVFGFSGFFLFAFLLILPIGVSIDPEFKWPEDLWMFLTGASIHGAFAGFLSLAYRAASRRQLLLFGAFGYIPFGLALIGLLVVLFD